MQALTMPAVSTSLYLCLAAQDAPFVTPQQAHGPARHALAPEHALLRKSDNAGSAEEEAHGRQNKRAKLDRPMPTHQQPNMLQNATEQLPVAHAAAQVQIQSAPVQRDPALPSLSILADAFDAVSQDPEATHSSAAHLQQAATAGTSGNAILGAGENHPCYAHLCNTGLRPRAFLADTAELQLDMLK